MRDTRITKHFISREGTARALDRSALSALSDKPFRLRLGPDGVTLTDAAIYD